MGYADELYVTVRSSDSMNYFSNNTASDFTARLPHKLVLDGGWCAGVNEIWFTKHWFNLTNASIQISIEGTEFEEYYLMSGYYDDNVALMYALNKLVDGIGPGIASFMVNELNHRVHITTRSDVKIKLSENICALIGAPYGGIIGGEWGGSKSMDIHSDCRMVMVCVDFISQQLFSDNMLNVIKMVDSSHQYFGEVVHDNVLTNYAKVCKDTFDTIHVQLKDSSGRVLKSVGGSCAIQLRFNRLT